MKTMLYGTAAALALTLVGCNKDDGGKSKKDGARAAPSAAEVIPGSFKNTTDEAGFRGKLPATSQMLKDTTSSFALRNPSVSNSHMNLTKALVGGVAKRIALPRSAMQALVSATPISEDEGTDMQAGEDAWDQVQSFQTGDDCTGLLVNLTDSYDQVVDTYSQGVSQLAAVDFSQAKGFTKDVPNSAQEAFAYKFALTSDDMPQGGELQGSMQGGKLALNGRFSGGANDSAVALLANGQATYAGDGGKIDLALDLNTYADVPAKLLSFGLGLDLGMTGQDEDGRAASGNARFTLEAKLQGGVTPAQTFKVAGNLSDGSESHTAEMSVSLQRQSAATMVLQLSGKADDHALTETVAMAIAQDGFGYDTCKVTKVTH